MPIEDYQNLPTEKDKLSEFATPEALAAGGAESSAVPFKPLEFGDVQPKQTAADQESILDKRDLSEGFVTDLRTAIARESGQNINPFALGSTPREVLDNAVSKRFIPPDFKPEEYMGAITPYWNGYKASKEANFGGAMLRGAVSNTGATLGGIVGGAIGSAVPLPGIGFAGGIAGSIKGGQLQEEFFPPTPAERAQIMFDYDQPDTKLGRMVGEFLPSFLTLRPGLEKGKELIKSVFTAAGIDVGFAAKQVYEGAKLDPEEFVERLAFDVATSILTKPNRVGQYLFNRNQRRDLAAIDQSKQFLRGALGVEGKEAVAARAEQAAANIEQGAALNKDGINIGSANLSDVSGLIAMQGALERRNNDLMQTRRVTEANISGNLGKVMQETGQSAEYAQLKFEGQNQAMLQEAAALRDAAIAKGNLEGAKILDNALAYSAKLESDVLNRASDANVASVESVNAFNNAVSEFAQYSGIQTKATASNSARTRFDANEQLSADIADAAYNKIKEEGNSVLTDFSSTYRAALQSAGKKYRSLSERKAGTNLDPAITRVIEAYKPVESGGRRKYSINTLIGELKAVNAAIRKAQADSMPYAALNNLKDGMERDLSKLGEMSKTAKKAFAIYREHKNRYYNDASMGALDRPPSEFLDHYLSKGSLEAYKQFRLASSHPTTGEVSPAVFDEIAAWQLNRLVDKYGVKPDVRSLEKWYADKDLSTVFEVFPEVQPKIKDIISKISKAQDNVDEMLRQENLSNKNVNDAQSYVDAQIKAAETKKAETIAGIAKEQQSTFDEVARSIQDSAATRFLGPHPDTAIENIFSDKKRNPVKEFASLMQSAQQTGDPGTLEGIRNALRKYIAKNTARYASVVQGKPLDVQGEITTKDLGVIIGKLNEELMPNSAYRQVMDMVLPPQEVLALKTAREQTRALLRRTSLTQGESSTAFNTLQDIITQEGLSGNAMSVLFRFAKGLDPSKRSALTSGTEATVNLVRKLWKGDIKTRTEQLMVDFVSKPDVAVEMLRSLNADSKTRIESFLRAWTVSTGLNQTVKPLPFAPQNVYEEDLKNGTVTTDFQYGYKIVKTPQGKYKLFSADGQPAGIYGTKSEAEQKAVNKHIERIMNQK